MATMTYVALTEPTTCQRCRGRIGTDVMAMHREGVGTICQPCAHRYNREAGPRCTTCGGPLSRREAEAGEWCCAGCAA